MIQLRLENEVNPIGALTGIYSDLPALRLCYFLNNNLNFRFVRSAEDYCVKSTRLVHNFISFDYFDEDRELRWQLVENRSMQEEINITEGLFSSASERMRWVNSPEKYDFFLWFDAEEGAQSLQVALLTALQQQAYIKAANHISGKLYKKIVKHIN